MPNNKSLVTMALFSESGPAPEQTELQATTSVPGLSLHQAIWLKQGDITANNKRYLAGDGFYLPSTTHLQHNNDTAVVRFVCAIAPSDTSLEQHCLQLYPSTQQRNLIASKTFSSNLARAVLRLDRVDFPPGAIAYRHTHPGGGFRYLTSGSLALHTDHDIQNMSPGEAWFEPENSPVKAVADTVDHSQFVRMLLLPSEFENRSSFTLANEMDADKPRLQTTHRYFDESIVLND